MVWPTKSKALTSSLVGATLVGALILAPSPFDSEPAHALPVVSTDWMANDGYGIAMHWTSQSVAAAGGSPAAFCTAVNNFDVDLLATQLSQAGAGYLLFTMGHAQMYLPFPNATLDSVISGRTCTRDLALDMYNALAVKGIKMMFYYPSVAVDDDPAWVSASQYNTNKPYFTQLQYDIVTEIGNRYGDKLAGWWIDNNFDYAYSSTYSYPSYTTALRAGNADRVVTFNFSSIGAWNSTTGSGYADYQAGEADVDDLTRVPSSRYSGEGGTQWQTLTYLDDFWVHSSAGTPTPRKSDNKIALYVKAIMNASGAISLNAAPYQDSLISAPTMSQLQALKSAVRDSSIQTAVVDDTDFTYSGTWARTSATSYHLNTGAYTQTAGSSASYTFTGPAITLYGPKGPDHGRADVTIDGGPAVTVDLYAASRQDVANMFSASALGNGTHTVTVTARADTNVASSGSYVEIDAAEVAKAIKTDDSASAVSYSSGWATNNIPAHFGGTAHHTLSPGATATFSFTGTNAALLAVKGPDHGKVDVSIDGGASTVVDLYQSQWTSHGVAYSVSGLTSGSHTMTVTARSDKNAAASNYFVEVDGFQQQY